MNYLPFLEDEALCIIRRAFDHFPPLQCYMLFSGGKDSCVLRHLVCRVMKERGYNHPNMITVDTGYNFPEINAFLRQFPSVYTGRVPDFVKYGLLPYKKPGESRNADQAVVLKHMIKSLQTPIVFGGARRDEDKARAKERVFSHRNANGNWLPEHQRPEYYGYKTDLTLAQGEHFRVFPLSNWIETDVWQYIKEHNVQVPSLYFAHVRDGKLVRFRTIGDSLVTKPIESNATTVDMIIDELSVRHISERGSSRLDDKAVSMEARKKQGYF